MATVLINETVKKYLLGQSKDIRKKLREKFEFLETGLWEGKLRVRKIKSVSSKCVFVAPVDKKNKVLFTLGADIEGTEKALFVYVWGIAAREEPSKKSRLIIPDNVPFLRFQNYEEVLLEDICMEELSSPYFTQELITEKTKDESESQRWYPVDDPEWKRIQLYTKDDFELYLHLSPEQKEILRAPLPVLAAGTAGSGKTTLSVYFLLRSDLKRKTKIFLTYNRHLKNFAESLYKGLMSETDRESETLHPNFHVLKELNLAIAGQFGKIFPPEKEVDLPRFSRMFVTHPLFHKFDSALVWEEIRSILKGALPQVNSSILEKAIPALKNDQVNTSLIKQLQQQFILFSKLESLRAVDGFVSKYLNIDISSFSSHIERYLKEKAYRDRVLSILDRTLNVLKKKRAAFEKKHLSFLEYELLGRKKAPNFQFSRKDIYHIFEWYQDRLENNRLWDELDLTREVLKIYSEKNVDNHTYDILSCDEVQDFTDIQIGLMLQMVQNPSNTFFAGDTKQIINPSGFRWEEVKRHFYERGLEVPEVKYLTLNFRNSGSIIEISNMLLGLKEKYLGIKAEELREEWRYKGRPVAVVTGIVEDDMLEILRMAGAKRTILVRTAKEKTKLKKLLETELVFTLGEAKGLEFNTVVLWKFSDDELVKDVWKVILDKSKKSIHEAKIKHEINLLYVGITRSQKDLIIYDGRAPSLIWENEPFKNSVYITGDRSYINGIWNVLSTPHEWVEQGRYFFERDYYRAAMECFKNGGDGKLLSAASAHYYEKMGKYLDAATHFEKSGDFKRAADDFEKAGEFKKALPLWNTLKNEDRALNCRIEIFKKEGKFHKAGTLYLEIQMYEEAVNCFKESRDFKKTAEIYLNKLRNIKQAAGFFELSRDFNRAAGLYARLKSYEKAAELYYKGGTYPKAEEFWKKTKNEKRLLELYEKTGQNDKLLTVYEKQENFEKTVKCLKTFKDTSRLVKEGKDLLTRKKYFRALVRYYVVNDLKKIAECYLGMKQHVEAIKYFKLAGDFYSAANTYSKNKDYKNALENFLNSEKDRKNGYPLAKSMSRRIRDDQWLYKLGKDFLVKKKYAESIALFSAFNNTFPEIGTCYAQMGDTEKALKIWKKCRYGEDYERLADICISSDITEMGASFFLSRWEKEEYSLGWNFNFDLKKSPIIVLLDLYFGKERQSEEKRVWGNFLAYHDFHLDIWKKVLDSLEEGGDYGSLIKYFRRFKFLEEREFEMAQSRLRREIPELIKSSRWEKLAFRYLILSKTDELNKIIPKIKINAYTYIFYLVGEKKFYEKGVGWCLKNNLLEDAGRLLLRVDEVERAAEVFEKGGILNKAADFYEEAGRLEKAASLYRQLKRYTKAGDVYTKMHDYKNALKMYQRQSPPNKKKMAKTYERMEDYGKALRLWKETGDKKGQNKCLKNLEKKGQRMLQFPPSE